MEESQLKGDLASTAEYPVASPPAMDAWERVGRNTAIGGASPVRMVSCPVITAAAADAIDDDCFPYSYPQQQCH